MAEYIIQKAVSMSAVVKGKRQSLEAYGASFDAYYKYDGCCAILSNGSTQSRTGERYQCLDGVAQDLFSKYPNLVFIGEAWWPGKDQFNLISGAFRRQCVNLDLLFMVHDILTTAEFDAGHSPIGYSERMTRADLDNAPRRVFPPTRLPAGTYGCPQKVCNQLADEGGYDGLILADPNGTWTVGRGTTGEKVKIKRELSFDLTVLEVNTAIGGKTGRTVYKLVVDFKGQRLGVGSGVPHKASEVPKVGDIVEVVAMDYSSEGLLREPRFKGVRFDKLSAD